MIRLIERSNGGCNTFDDPFGKKCALNKTENLSINV